jgi:tetratricopeptide (TPR) repeat protein
MMSICQFIQKKYSNAKTYAEKAQKVYPSEAQAQYIGGIANLRLKDFDSALEDFRNYDRLLPGNPKITFFKGYSLEGMGSTKQAAELYYKYLQTTTEGDEAQHAYNRLVEWGYL